MRDLLGNSVAFVFALGVIIFVHEGGHYLMAKAFGVRVLTFSLGFGRRIWGFRRGETDYRVSLVPLGGYVKLSGEDPGEAAQDPRDFVARPRWQRILIFLAGPLMNAVLAILLVAGLFMVGLDVPALQSIPSVVGTVEAGSPAESAGLLPGDEIVELGGKAVTHWQEVAFSIMTSVDRPLAVLVERGDVRQALTLVPHKMPGYEFGDAGLFPKVLPKIAQLTPGAPAEKAGFQIGDEVRGVDGRSLTNMLEFVSYIEQKIGQPVKVQVLRAGAPVVLTVVPADQGGKGRIGVSLTISQRYPPGRALLESVRFNYEIARQSLVVVGKIFTREVAAKSALAGPLEIAAQSGAAARSGIKNLLYLMAVISVSIGLLNLFPIPLLDGGQISLLLVESGLRRDLPLAWKERINQVGLVLIVLLMVTVLYFDFSKTAFVKRLSGS